MGVTGDDTGLLERDDSTRVQTGHPTKPEDIMKAIKYVAPWLAAAAIGGAVALAPIASAAAPSTATTHSAPAAGTGTDPLVPYGTDPHSPYVFGYHVSNHDEANTTNGQVDVPF
jgi:hypothetical protein